MVVRLDFDSKSQKVLGLSSDLVNRALTNLIRDVGDINEDTTERIADTLLLPRVRQINPSNIQRIPSPRYLTSSQDDLEWSRLRGLTPQKHLFDTGPFVPGHLTGLWAGKLMVSNFYFQIFLRFATTFIYCPIQWTTRKKVPPPIYFIRGIIFGTFF